MRYALPIWHRLSKEVQDKLVEIAKANGGTVNIPPCEWVEWQPTGAQPAILEDVVYDKFIRRAPSRSRK